MQAALAQRRAATRARLQARIDQGMNDGELPPDTDTAVLADFYATVLAGMSLQARDGATRKSLMATVAAAMRAWPESPPRPVKSPRRELARA
jgi:hypothetical protein